MTALRFIGRNWRLFAIGGLVAALLASIAIGKLQLAHQRATTAHVMTQLDRAKSAFDRTVSAYRLTAANAALADARNVQRVRVEQSAITEGIEHAYQDRLGDSTARYERLRAQAAAYTRGAPAADVSAARDAACLAYASARCDELPTLLKAAQDNTDQLVALIAWTKAQSAVDVTGKAAP